MTPLPAVLDTWQPCSASSGRAGYRAVVLDNLVYGHRRIVEDVLKVPLVVVKLE